jgi:hypothetical protein
MLLVGTHTFTQAEAARQSIYRCTAQDGSKVFQDRPCGAGTAQGQNSLRWSPLRRGRGACLTQSPLMALRLGTGENMVYFDGGASVVLLADESGITASIVVRASWPVNIAKASDESATSDSTAAAIGRLNIGARAVELSGDIARQGVLNARTGLFKADRQVDATRISFGYGQTQNLLRALGNSGQLQAQLTLRAPEITLQTTPLEVADLASAVRSVASCARNK